MSIPLNIDWQQILLHLFNFAILSGGLYLLLYRPVKAFMDQRQAYYQNLHQEAEQLKEQADRMKVDYQSKMSQVEADMARRRADAEKELMRSGPSRWLPPSRKRRKLSPKPKKVLGGRKRRCSPKPPRSWWIWRSLQRKKLRWVPRAIPTSSS